MSVISVKNVSKWYGQVVAVSDISFELEPGVIGLLGPNGAGKTTLLKMLGGLLWPSKGEIRLLGQPIQGNSQIYKKIGFCPEPDAMYDFMTGSEFLECNAGLQKLSDPKSAARRALEIVDLTAQKDKKISAYSRGMRQRLKLAQSLLHDPELLLLDEPLKGADPTQRRALIELIKQLGQAGKTIFVSSHVLYEVERMAHEIIFINRGRLVALGDFHAIRESMYNRPHKVLLEVSDPTKLASLLTERALVSGVNLSTTGVTVEVTQADAFYGNLPKLATETGIQVRKLVSLDDDLESVFHYLVK
ncbi:ABC transporter ATP-binding protein [Candidatus Acetothermia bacterium]|nr:ABC transporter ATP-binding protein [Candidatus Acetothermia bacterium]MBI3461429.1 ABC transporter ATP-binding protein [Candidatus Acetothermia bacterium]MBI3659783.1 ABC transporter ATP-binding protein [Candidatus Acetothermia bacterium]